MSKPRESWEYADYIVGFLDVLGMSDMVEQSQQDPALRIRVGRLLKELNEIVANRNKTLRKESRVRLDSFSDSIKISCPTISEPSFRIVLWIICEFFVKSITHGCFLRGALTVGSHWENKRTFFGPAFIKVYDMERSLALWPRCIIDPAVLSKPDICPRGAWEKRFQYILKGNDGLPYLDYLRYSFSARIILTRDEQDTELKTSIGDLADVFIKVIEIHKRMIYRAIEQAKLDHVSKMLLVSKYYPLAEYHNTVIQRMTRGTPKTADLNSISPNSWAGRQINDLVMMATQAGIEIEQIERMKQMFINAMVDVRLEWRSQLIDLDGIFRDAWKPDI